MSKDYLGKPGAVCACGKHFGECDYWQKILNSPEIELVRDERLESVRIAVEGSGGWRKIFWGDSELLKGYRGEIGRLWSRLFESLPAGCETIVDSSKSGADSIWRPIALWRLLGFQVKVIHLVRDVRGVMTSHGKGANTSMEKGEQNLRGAAHYFTLLHWMWMNSLIAFQRFMLPKGSFLTISYEKFIADPQSQIERIAKFLGLDPNALRDVVREGVVYAGGHQVYGNRMRFQQTVPLKADNRWQSDLPRPYQWLGAAAMKSWAFFQSMLAAARS